MGGSRYLLLALALTGPLAPAQEPQSPAVGGPRPDTVRAFDAYVRQTEARVDALLRGRDTFLWANTAARRAKVRANGVVCEPQYGNGDRKVTGGLIHDWAGAAFIPGATVAQVLTPIQDYDNHKKFYKPDVIESRTIERRGDDFKVRLRLFQRKILTVVLDTDYDVHYSPLGGNDWQSRSHSTRIVEISNPGPREREKTAREDRGFLWRLNTYWLFREREGGVYVECEAISLSRGAPAKLAWIIEPIVRNLPESILANALRVTRALVLADAPGRRGR